MIKTTWFLVFPKLSTPLILIRQLRILLLSIKVLNVHYISLKRL